jgi:hydrogenase maturation factor
MSLAVAGMMLGEVEKDRLVTTSGARVGDAVVMTKGVPLEGAAIIAREKEAELRALGISPTVIRRARAFLKTPGLSVRPEAEIACELTTVHAMHDPTEGGIATALVELANAAGVGLRIDRAKELLRESEYTVTQICHRVGFNSLSHFTTTFRQHTGFSPSAYRRRRDWEQEAFRFGPITDSLVHQPNKRMSL